MVLHYLGPNWTYKYFKILRIVTPIRNKIKMLKQRDQNQDADMSKAK